MGTEVFWVLELNIINGKEDQLDSLISDMSAATKLNEPNTLYYEWFVDEAKKTCTIYERYTDSDALLIHMGNFGENFAERFMSIFEISTFTVFGTPSDDAIAALDTLGAKYMHFAGGFHK